MSEEVLLRAEGVHKTYLLGQRSLEVLRGVEVEVRRGGFLVPAPGVWGLLWSFSCRSGRGTFAVTEAGTGQALVVRAAGPVGRGLLWDTHDAGHQGLVIRTACSWAVKVVLPR